MVSGPKAMSFMPETGVEIVVLDMSVPGAPPLSEEIRIWRLDGSGVSRKRWTVASVPEVTVPTSNASMTPGVLVSALLKMVVLPNRVTLGVGGGAELLTVTLTGADVVVLPARSRATA